MQLITYGLCNSHLIIIMLNYTFYADKRFGTRLMEQNIQH